MVISKYVQPRMDLPYFLINFDFQEEWEDKMDVAVTSSGWEMMR